MKITLMAIIMTLVSTMAMATDSGPSIEPGPAELQDSEALNVLLYQVPSEKLADLKAGSNTMAVQTQNMTPNVIKYIYTSRNCYLDRSMTGHFRCTENKGLTVLETLKVIPGSRIITKSYKVSAVVGLR